MFIKINDTVINTSSIKKIDYHRDRMDVNHYPYTITFNDGVERDVIVSNDLFEQFTKITPAPAGYKMLRFSDDSEADSYDEVPIIAFVVNIFGDAFRSYKVVTAEGTFDPETWGVVVVDPLGRIYSNSQWYESLEQVKKEYLPSVALK